MKSSRGLVLIAAIPVLAACGSSGKTAQIPLSNVATPPPASTSHAPTTSSSKPAAAASSKAVATTTPAPAATSHASAAPVITPAHNVPAQNTPARNTPVQQHPAPATGHTRAAPVTHAATAPVRTTSAPSPRSTASAIAPTRGKAPVIVTPTPGRAKQTKAAKTPFTAALADSTGPVKGSPTKNLSDGTWTVDVRSINTTSVTVDVLGPATGHCTDDCLEPIGSQTIPLASVNISTILPMLSTEANWTTKGITAPAWAYAEIFNQGLTGLKNVSADPHYTISSALKAKIDSTFGSEKDVYSHITIKNGVVTNLSWTYHP